MGKISFITVLVLLTSVSTKAQILISLLLGDKLNTGKIEFGLEGGLTLTSLKNLQDAKTYPSFNLGFYFDFKLKNPSWMFNTGVVVKSAMGAEGLPVYALGDQHLDSAFAGGSVTRRIDYFNVPLMIKYNFKNHIHVKAGVQLGLRYNAHDKFKNSVHDKDDLEYELKTKDQFTRLDAGLAAGLGYRLMKGNGMDFGIRYYYGLVDVVIDDASPKQFNRALYVTTCIPIGKGKKQNKEKTN